MFSKETFDGAVNAYKKLIAKTSMLIDVTSGEIDKELFNAYKYKFAGALENNLNTSLSVTVLYDVLKDDTLNDFTKKALIAEFDKVLGLNLLTKQENKIDEELEKYIGSKIAERLEAKKNKDYQKADEIRAELLSRGITLKDTPNGTEYFIS